MLINKDVNNKFLNFIKNINFNFFLLFVFVSSFIWVITKFSNIYKLNNEFGVEWINIPDTISVNNQQKKISILFSASGFEMILYKIFKKNIQISIDRDVLYKENNGINTFNKSLREIVYIVKRGDSLSRISYKYGVSIKNIKKWNNIKGTNIKIGDKLIIYTKY